MFGLAASIAFVVCLVCIVFGVYALRSRAARSHISILSLIVLLLVGASLGVYASVGRFPIGKAPKWTTLKIIVSQPRSLRPAELR